MRAEVHLVDLPLLPLEQRGGLVVGADEAFVPVTHLAGHGMGRPRRARHA